MLQIITKQALSAIEHDQRAYYLGMVVTVTCCMSPSLGQHGSRWLRLAGSIMVFTFEHICTSHSRQKLRTLFTFPNKPRDHSSQSCSFLIFINSSKAAAHRLLQTQTSSVLSKSLENIQHRLFSHTTYHNLHQYGYFSFLTLFPIPRLQLHSTRARPQNYPASTVRRWQKNRKFTANSAS
jgi:hypothetical protein